MAKEKKKFYNVDARSNEMAENVQDLPEDADDVSTF
jgi:hypothetical protein